MGSHPRFSRDHALETGECSHSASTIEPAIRRSFFRGAARVGSREKGSKKQRLIQLPRESSAARLESGLLSNWSKNKRFFEPRSNWLHDCMFDFRCNFKIMAAAEGDANSEFSAALTSSLEDFIHSSKMSRQNASEGSFA